MCQFCSSREDLVDSLGPYLAAGLGNDERCLWIASSSFPAEDVATKIAKSPELNHGLASGQLRILDAVDWYGKPGSLTAEEFLQRCLQHEEQALADGHQGLRIAGDMSSVRRTEWDWLMECEKLLHDLLQSRRIVMCCSYSSEDCQPVEILDALRCHHAALERTGPLWQVFMQESNRNRERRYLHHPSAAASDEMSENL
jgi:hypothetical protein